MFIKTQGNDLINAAHIGKITLLGPFIEVHTKIREYDEDKPADFQIYADPNDDCDLVEAIYSELCLEMACGVLLIDMKVLEGRAKEKLSS